MSQSANVDSIEAVREFRHELHEFQADAREAVTALALELRRALDWLEHDRASYWPAQVRQAEEAVAQARNDLERKQLRLASEDPPSCFQEQKILQQAIRRRRLCEQKIEAVRRWRRVVGHEAEEFQGRLARVNDLLDADLPRALAALARMLDALEKYAGPGSSHASAAPPPSGDAP